MRAMNSRSLTLLVVALASVAPVRADGLSDLQAAVTAAAERVKPAVVSITAERAGPAVELPIPLPDPEGRGVSRGSGMLFRETDQAYFVLTNAHVVRGARGGQVKVQIVAEREERDGQVVAADARTDTAIVKIEKRAGDRLTTVAIGQAADLRIGTFVLAIGSPFGFEWSVSFGIVSGLDRELREPVNGREAGRRAETYRGLVQTDASINPGNSGGPLINLRGEVIGINFAIWSPNLGGNVGIGFAIPIDRAVKSADDIIAYGRVKRGYLGVLVSDLEQVAKSQKITLEELRRLLGVDAGAFVNQVNPATPAAKAGLEAGDVVVALNGEPIASSGMLVDRVAAVPPDTEVNLEVVRGGERVPLKLTVAELPDEAAGGGPAAPPVERPRRGPDPLGLKVAALTQEKAKELGLDPRGVLVTEVAPTGVAAGSGLVPDCVLLRGRLDRTLVEFDAVETYEQFMERAAAANATVQLWFSAPPDEPTGQRGVRSLFLKVPKPAAEAPQ